MRHSRPMNPTLRILLENITVRRKNRPLIAGLDWDLGSQGHWAVIGPNGAGKTTLLKVLSGLLWPDSRSRRTYVLDSRPTSSPLPIRPLIRFLGPETLETFARHAPFLSVL
ncbi:MAG: ATP-binding cassette domain-containing protein, partial [Deltaproteobacteria bacterium]|nr:ATP-binding cassette domain-containing protein [Deltaproteobacteria bacterium]